VVFLFIQISPEDIDVNVHPTKIEVRFYNANLVHSQILGCLREKLLATSFDIDARLPTTHPRSQKINDAMAEFFKKYKPVQTQQQLGFSPTSSPKGAHKDPAYRSCPANQTIESPAALPLQKKFVQIHDSFIVSQTDTGFIIIDQHALHERIMYEDLSRRVRKSKLESQKLLIPQSFELTGVQAEILKDRAELVERLGIEIVPFGPGTMAIQSFPILLAKTELLDFVRDLIEVLVDEDNNFDAEKLLDEILKMAACKAAIKAGQKLSDTEIEQLLADRDTAEIPDRCPHGRPTTINFSIPQLERQFKRT
jgi:DNA mismatch repair protein MutL